MSDYITRSYTILYELVLEEHHHQTGKTKHFFGETLSEKPYMLQIVQYSNGSGYNLVHLDESRQKLTDTYHDSVDQAMAQANWEFLINQSQWKFINQGKEYYVSRASEEMLERITQELRARIRNRQAKNPKD
ncbi:MAG: hypothetical protein F6J87_16770 [Spirulina sp. SIO3F2]|nr:hypothetical protein [Spirulina sp. SIO3F2]